MSEEEKAEGDAGEAAAEEHKSGLHVDEDWKKAVEEERRRLREEEDRGAATQPPGADDAGRFPEPSVPIFMAGLYTQTLMALGDLEIPGTGERRRNVAEAQYLIDTIALLSQKMAGNLDEEEAAYVQNLLTDLRMRYVGATGGAQQESAPGAEGT